MVVQESLCLFTIAYAFRPRLRIRLTPRRLAWHGNPWIFGGGVSHPSCRYWYRHDHFPTVHLSLRSGFNPVGNALLPLRASAQSVASVICLAPLHFRRIITRPVSCYALFKWMAASKPTSWLSVHLHILSHWAYIRDLSWRSGLFPSRLRSLSPAVWLPWFHMRYSEFGRVQ
jgi:hypothetical protein